MISISHWGMFDGGWAEAVDRERKRMFRQESGHYSCDVEVWAERIKDPEVEKMRKELRVAYLRAWCEASRNKTPLPTWPDDYNKEYIFD